MTSDRHEHWQQVYENKPDHQVSWHQNSPKLSLKLIQAAGAKKGCRILDVGGGASRLVDHLVGLDYKLSVLDLAEAALDRARTRLGEAKEQVEWIAADITTVELPGTYDLWHDRAVFHFLTEESDREAYKSQLRKHLADDGAMVIATFAPNGPERCSGLPVVRYSPEGLSAELGDGFQLVESEHESHRTPAGRSQLFTYCRFQRT